MSGSQAARQEKGITIELFSRLAYRMLLNNAKIAVVKHNMSLFIQTTPNVSKCKSTTKENKNGKK